MPSPLYPTSPGYDHSMRQRERALVESLDQRRGSLHAGSPTSPAGTFRSLSPIAEQGAGRRASLANLSPPSTSRRSPHSPSRVMQHPKRQTLADETRSILLSGLPDIQQRPLGASSTTTAAERRRSLPSSFPTARRGSHQRRQELQAWGHVYFGNGSEADCFVSPLALRRPSEGSSGDEGGAAKDRGYDGPTRIIRARVRPRALDQKPFILQRTFNMDELRAAIPEPEPVSAGRDAQSRDRRRSSEIDKTTPIRGSQTVPIHIGYARAYFPILAALIYSGHVRPGDIIDLPLPHPEAWNQTVAHVYTGQGELTEAVRQNILYLGGKV
ncbi:hypothetical protein B0T22DRAFT_41547 [Podospora appendiculata]|uniref:Uncharacterized protein n=1 Tax=Podospora appendiculata TaxID=314037 RepID=A0AAE0XHG1_9PEZI|nr:hypothetical protein B0T22DRAFT_41547 [Podospora appendiculata]